jgi:hypothetical protein
MLLGLVDEVVDVGGVGVAAVVLTPGEMAGEEVGVDGGQRMRRKTWLMG